MDWDVAIKRNSEVLAGIVETLFVMLGLVGEATVIADFVAHLPGGAACSASRRILPAPTDCRCSKGPCDCARCLPSQVSGGRKTQEARDFTSLLPALRSAATHRAAAPEKISKRAVPRIHFFNTDGDFITIGSPIRPAKASAPARTKSADGMVNAARVIRRLEALEAALADLPRQAKRLVRWRMREEKSENPSFKTPLRPGRPPGSRRRAVHLVDELLDECQWLAFRATMPDTS